MPVEANTTYIASYHTTVGHYAVTPMYFATSGVENGPLQALSALVSGNGVYSYSPASTFPHSTYLAANYWVDVVFDPNAVDTTIPAIVSAAPSGGAVVSPGSSIAITFSEAIAAATVNGATFELFDAATNAPIAAAVAHAPATRVTISPTTPLLALRSYRVRVRGGSGGVADVAGNPLAADREWTFSIGKAAIAPDQGPGGPILLIAAPEHPFTTYSAEILRAEGLTAFAVMPPSAIAPAVLANYDVVVLGSLPLSTGDVAVLTNWVTGGGRLIAMRPDKKLASLLGLVDAGGVVSDQYLSIDTASAPGQGLVGQTMQFHGGADLYTTAGATTIATLYATATTSASRPAVTRRNVGTQGGQAVAFTFDLARSVAYTRQGNPAWAGQERDGIAPIRPNDLFWGGDSDPDWVDLDKVAIPQAEEQQRLLANLILQMSVTRRPLPRFWYLPEGMKAAVIMTSDDHGSGGTAPRFASFLAESAPGCSVDDWQCIRATSYIYTATPLAADEARTLDDLGFEVALHVTTGCADYTAATIDSFFHAQLADWASSSPGVRRPVTNRTHCLSWSDWASQAGASARNGIRLDTNYYYWPVTWASTSPGLFTGAGLPMRFASAAGTIEDVYQASTQITDESGQSVPATIDVLLDRALGTEGYYGVFTVNMHADFAHSEGAAAIIASARQRGVAVVSARQMLTWLDGRNATSYRDLAWDGSVLTFTLELGVGARGLETMVPLIVDGSHVASITADGAAVAFREETIKGIAYAMFRASSAPYRVTYAPPPDRLSGVVTDVTSGTPLANVTVSAYDTNGNHVVSGFSNAAGAYRAEGLAAGTYFVRTSNTQGYADQVHSGVTCNPACVLNSGTPVLVNGTSSIAPVNFALLRDRAEIIYPAANAIDVVTTRRFEWTGVPGADAYILHIGTAPDTWNVLAAGLLTDTTFLVTTTLPTDTQLHVRVGARVGGVWRYGHSVPFRAARMTAAMIYPAANATGVATSRDFEWQPVAGADAYILHVGTAPGTWDVLAAGLLTQTTHRVITVLRRIGRSMRASGRASAVFGGGAQVHLHRGAGDRAAAVSGAQCHRRGGHPQVPVDGCSDADAYILHVGTAPRDLERARRRVAHRHVLPGVVAARRRAALRAGRRAG